MAYFGKFYLDKEKDIIVTLDMHGDDLSYVITSPHHKTGNLITNLAKVCKLEISYDDYGYKIIKGDVPCFYDGDNEMVYILRFYNTKVANIYPDGRIERKAYVPAIAKTLMSQTKDYKLDIEKTLVKTYIRREVKFHSDLHTHRSANLSPDILIALAIHHQLRYPYYYIKKLQLNITPAQKALLENRRQIIARSFAHSQLKGKYLDRKIDDHTYLNFASLILENIEHASENIAKIRASLAVMKDGQAVFTNLEKVYIFRYVFTKGTSVLDPITLEHIDDIEDEDIVNTLKQMELDRLNPVYRYNTLYQDQLLFVARSYQKVGVTYAEISDTALVKASEAANTLAQIHEVMPAITKETGVTLRFLCAFRRIPLTIVKDQIGQNGFNENLQVLKAVANDPYVAGSDFVGEEMNDIRELSSVIQAIVAIAKDIPSFVIRFHAGENDSLPDNVLNSVLEVEKALAPGQFFPHVRLGHGLYTPALDSQKGKLLLEKLKDYRIALEFQITSNVRLNNLTELTHHPLKDYLRNDIRCVQGTDGGALYGTNSIDEQLSLERMLDLSFEEMKKMHDVEAAICHTAMQEFHEKMADFKKALGIKSVATYYNERIDEQKHHVITLTPTSRNIEASVSLASKIKPLPLHKIPIVIVGGSFNNVNHQTELREDECHLLDELIDSVKKEDVFFVIGSSMSGYEKYLLDHAIGFEVYSFVPKMLTEKEAERIKKEDVGVRISIESSPLGVYKSFAFEIFKRRSSLLLALDGHSAASNMIQDAKNSQYKCWIVVDESVPSLVEKASSLEGYVTFWKPGDGVQGICEMLKRTIID